MNREELLKIIKRNPGKFFGVILGFMFSIMVILMGVIKTIFIALCIYLGYYVGDKIDNHEDLWILLDRILPRRKL